MLPPSSENVLNLATLSASLLFLFFTFFLGVWCWRADRRLRRLEAAARRTQLDALAVPHHVEEREPLEINLPCFIGSPRPGRKGSV